MDRKVPISDATITRNVSRQLSGCGLRSPCRIEVQTRNGEVTLSGTVQFVHQRNAAAQAIRTVEGVKRVVEKIKVTPPARHQYGQPAHNAKPRTPEISQPEAADAAPKGPAEVSDEPDPLPVELPASNQPEHLVSDASADTSFEFGHAPRPEPQAAMAGMPHSRKGESYTFECASLEEAEKLRAILARYADWLKKNAWVGETKPTNGAHRVTFHAKSVVEFLRQEGF